MQLKKIALLTESGSPTKEESVWAVDLGGSLFRIDNSPWFANGCALGDVIRCVDRDGQVPLCQEVVTRSGNLAIRVYVPSGPKRSEIKEALFDLFRKTGCKFESMAAEKGLIAATIPKDVEPEIVLAPLRDYQMRAEAFWESANF